MFTEKTITLQPSDVVRLKTNEIAMRSYINSNGQMMLTRMATPAFMRNLVTEYTGKTYPKSRKGLETALKDCQAILEAVKVVRETGVVQTITV